ncbi:MAG TPA: outer membrane protein assembly factor BamD [Amaricoccus sp.]|uniref:outer membrane protein assembly factor BamD n=1 Tax=Amaricoccus sp. TaxID=1872485 RepID=UPI002C77ACBF|nr:outer membrane protein assembly factor BamD [Amaricoccus sp.]HMQ91718.1 outer membrane protein assembly factor BamD [Amaricoccus sp.]HMR52570.1 outer membrane protein assembly factor BamD [Amaricoccus sp.]HMR59271.1 outer membrane protein assembly factor BamD [Amaricoccus sp.]HMT99560.1 outer membrane protein assembly factor BamD [Amaricoccus sp.]
MIFVRRWGRFPALAATFGMTLALGACSYLPASLGGQPTAPIETRSPQEIYLDGEALLATNQPREAGEMFGEVERLYPYSEWAKRAMLMSAFAYHEGSLFAESRAAAERYLDFYPADVDAPYAQFLIALSYYDQIVDIGRDQSNTFDALQEMRDIIERYPDSEYAASAQLKFELALDHLAGKEMEIGRYYLNRGFYTAAINRFRVVVEDYQTTTHTPEALHRLVESYLSLGLVDEAQTAAAILGHNFRGSPWYADSYVLLTGRGLRPADVESGSWLNQTYRQVVQGKWR